VRPRGRHLDRAGGRAGTEPVTRGSRNDFLIQCRYQKRPRDRSPGTIQRACLLALASFDSVAKNPNHAKTDLQRAHFKMGARLSTRTG
jgi:hypothetical protein